MPYDYYKKPSKPVIIDAIRRTRGILVDACELLNVPRHLLNEWIVEDPALTYLCNDLRESVVDKAEQKIYSKAIDEGNDRCLVFLLSSLGKNRGWGKEASEDSKKEGVTESLCGVIQKLVDAERQ